MMAALRPILECPLQPLGSLRDFVVSQFVKTMKRLKISVPQPPTAPSTSGFSLRSADPLDSVFPFDPYLLRHSEKFVSALYREWEAPEEEEEEDDAMEGIVR